jgi:hypothetical protein
MNIERLHIAVAKRLRILPVLLSRGKIEQNEYNTLKYYLSLMYRDVDTQRIMRNLAQYNAFVAQLRNEDAKRVLYIDLAEVS